MKTITWMINFAFILVYSQQSGQSGPSKTLVKWCHSLFKTIQCICILLGAKVKSTNLLYLLSSYNYFSEHISYYPPTHSLPIILASFLSLGERRNMPSASEPLHLLFLQLEMLPPQISARVTPSPPSCFCRKSAAPWSLPFKIAICFFPDFLPNSLSHWLSFIHSTTF